jgi:hypothetical protein
LYSLLLVVLKFWWIFFEEQAGVKERLQGGGTLTAAGRPPGAGQMAAAARASGAWQVAAATSTAVRVKQREKMKGLGFQGWQPAYIHHRNRWDDFEPLI